MILGSAISGLKQTGHSDDSIRFLVEAGLKGANLAKELAEGTFSAS